MTITTRKHPLALGYAIALAGLAAIAVHVVDDAFLRPPDGVGHDDRLIAAVVPLVLLAALAITWPALRPGTRAIWSLSLGVLALGVGLMTSVSEAVGRGPDGATWTGLAATAGGAVLIGVGAVTAWRSARTDGSRWRRWGRRAAVGAVAVLALPLVLMPIGVAIYSIHEPRSTAPANPELGAPHEDVWIETADGIRLHGWYIPSRNGAAVLAVPGLNAPLSHARLLIAHGYGVLLLDLRGQGASEGTPNGLGWNAQPDIEAGVAWLAARPDVDPGRIGAVGLSVGGEMLLEAAARDVPLAAVVSEGAGIRVASEALGLDNPVERVVSFVDFGLMQLAVTALSTDEAPPGLDSLMADLETPTYFIHASHGQGGEKLTERYYERAVGPKELWTVGGGHTQALNAEPQEYEQRVIGFLDRYLLD